MGYGYWEPDRETPCQTAEQRAAMLRRLAERVGEFAPPADPAATVLFSWPLRPAAHYTYPGYYMIDHFVDEDPAFPAQVLDYDCGDRSYDTSGGYNHGGTDIVPWPFMRRMMAEDDVEIVAAAPGTILWTEEGNFDMNCSWNGDPWNSVGIVHADGTLAMYGHMKSGSVTTKTAGETVVAGEYLGLVGSSGNSTAPHLHFEVLDSGGATLDPWGGPCNSLGGQSLWASQLPYWNSGINQLRTHRLPPSFNLCPELETVRAKREFDPGETAYFAAYYRDQLPGQTSTYTIYDANGGVFASWMHSSPFVYEASYWYFSQVIPLDAPLGVWRFEVVYEGDTYEWAFGVGDVVGVGEPEPHPTDRRLVAWPNPFARATTIRFDLARPGPFDVRVYDAGGRLVRTLVRDDGEAGPRSVVWDGTDGSGRPAGAGVYLCRLTTAGAVRTGKVILSR